MISALEQVHRAVVEQNKEKVFEAVTIFVPCFRSVFLPHTESFKKMFPKIESIKDDILAERFDDANCTALAFIAHFRMVRENLRHEPTTDDASG